MKNTLKENEKIISKVISFFVSKSNDNELNKLKEKYLNIIVKTINELLLIKNSGNTPEKVKKEIAKYYKQITISDDDIYYISEYLIKDKLSKEQYLFLEKHIKLILEKYIIEESLNIEEAIEDIEYFTHSIFFDINPYLTIIDLSKATYSQINKKTTQEEMLKLIPETKIEEEKKEIPKVKVKK